MNLFKSVRNALTGVSEASMAVGAKTPAVRPGPNPPPSQPIGQETASAALQAYYPDPKPADDSARNDWEKQFKCAPYLVSGYRFAFDLPFMRGILAVSGTRTIKTKAEHDVIVNATLRHGAAFKRLSESGHRAAHDEYAASITAHEGAVKRGEKPPEIISLEDAEKRHAATQGDARGEMRALAVELKPIYAAISERLFKAAEKTCYILDKEEREAAARFSAPFYPSYQLVSCVQFVLTRCNGLADNFRTSPANGPGDFIFGIVKPEDLETEAGI